MDLLLKDKVVLVTGSTRGIGKAIARTFLEEGSRVVITGLSGETTKRVESEFSKEFGDDRVLSYADDLTTENGIRNCVSAALSKFHRIDVLVANIGSGKGTTDWDVTNEEWSRMMDINFNGARKMTSAVVPTMQKNKRGAIIFISSIAGLYCGEIRLDCLFKEPLEEAGRRQYQSKHGLSRERVL